jgi:hypothetical protein
MNIETQQKQIRNFLKGRLKKDIDAFTIYQWIDRCVVEGWWELGIALGIYVPPNTLDESYTKRLNFLLTECRRRQNSFHDDQTSALTQTSGLHSQFVTTHTFVENIRFKIDSTEDFVLSAKRMSLQEAEVNNKLFQFIKEATEQLDGTRAVQKKSMVAFYSRSRMSGKTLGLTWIEYPSSKTSPLKIYFRKEMNGTYPMEIINEFKAYKKNGWGGYPQCVIYGESDARSAIKIIKYAYEHL